MPSEPRDIDCNDHLKLIRMHTNELQQKFDGPENDRFFEVRSMLWGVLDQVMKIENKLTKLSEGK